MHHCDLEGIWVNKWLDDEQPNHLPHYCTHQIGAGGFTLSKDGKRLLCIQEQKSAYPGRWKLPGGLVDQGESIATAVEREIKEETGVEAEFKGILSIRDLQGATQFKISDLYFVCLLEAKSEEIRIPEQASKSEILKAEWLDLRELQKIDFSRQSQDQLKLAQLVANEPTKLQTLLSTSR